jgi:threonyl-tRNA synthetase
MLVVGEKEQAAGTVAVRDRVDGDLGAMPLAQVVARLKEESEKKTIRQVSTATAGLSDSKAKYAG